MEALRAESLYNRLAAWVGMPVYVHLEINPGGYWRNGQQRLRAVHVTGSNPFRLYLELGEDALIQVDDLSHMELAADLVICSGYDGHQRIARTVEISTRPFAMRAVAGTFNL